jgi:hypothetical protein
VGLCVCVWGDGWSALLSTVHFSHLHIFNMILAPTVCCRTKSRKPSVGFIWGAHYGVIRLMMGVIINVNIHFCRWEDEMQKFTTCPPPPLPASPSEKKRKRRVKSPGAPKKPRTAYILFTMEHRCGLCEATLGGIGMSCSKAGGSHHSAQPSHCVN